jgi:hypothetical protein
MKIYVDIDNTICNTKNSDYANSIPIIDRINLINKLYNEGHTIIYWTARGSKSGTDWEAFTQRQLNSWGCLRNYVQFNKPDYDLYIDDKTINSNDFFSNIEKYI